MAKARTFSSKSMVRERARKRRQQKQFIPLVVVFGGVLLVLLSWFLINRNKPATATGAFSYGPEDVVYGEPLHAVHEMEPSNLASIPFLPKDRPQPKIVLQEDFHNFGSIGTTDVVQYEFAISNSGEAPLTISRAYTTCGCTTADFTATVIPPGKVVVVTLTLDAGFHDVAGQTVRRGLIIENNDLRTPQVEVWTQASIRRQ